jgi:hypothetical protein
MVHQVQAVRTTRSDLVIVGDVEKRFTGERVTYDDFAAHRGARMTLRRSHHRRHHW